MHFHDIRSAAAGRSLLSFELFPPRSSEAAAKAVEAVDRLAAISPDFLVTQTFFENRDFDDFRARCELAGIRVPILAGILPLPGRATFLRMAELAGGMRYPARLLRALKRAGEDPEAFRRVAVQHAVAQCSDLLDHEVDGLHFYTLNQTGPVLAALAGLGLARSGTGWMPRLSPRESQRSVPACRAAFAAVAQSARAKTPPSTRSISPVM